MTKHIETVKLLQRHFDIALETPDGIKKLRELILTLAMQGKLVPQDPKDQPASELLKEIEAEKKRLFKEGKIKKQEPLPPVKPEEIPYEVPKGWVWVRLGELGESQTGTTPPSKDRENFGNHIPFIGPGNIKNNEIDYSGAGLSAAGLSKGRLIRKHSVLMVCIGGSIGKHAVNDRDITCNQQINTLTPYQPFPVKYLSVVMASQIFQKAVTDQAGGSATPIINKQKWSSVVVPVPPLLEQHSIIAKIDQLMALCDKLESERNERNQKRLTVHTAAMNRLLTAPDKTDFDKSWHFITRHFGELYSVPQNVAELKKAILQLAVMGKLVPQDPKNQPASELLKEIEAEKKLLVKEGKIKKQELLPPIKPEEMPYEVPKGWEWVRLGDIATFENGDRSSRYPNENDHQASGIPFFGAKDMVDGLMRFDNGLRFISEAKFSELSNGKLIDRDFVVLLRGTVGKMAIFLSTAEFSTGFINAQMLIIRMLNKELCNFFSSYSKTNFFQSLVANKTTGSAVRQMPANVLVDFLMPLPPLPEQKRIVAKIDQLMALCDALDKQISSATEKQTAILNAVLAKV